MATLNEQQRRIQAQQQAAQQAAQQAQRQMQLQQSATQRAQQKQQAGMQQAQKLAQQRATQNNAERQVNNGQLPAEYSRQNTGAQQEQTYTPGSAVMNAQQQLAQLQANKPQGYTSKYGAQLDNILNQIQNPQEFKYSFVGDELFKMYADMYTQNGKQASMDAMGQAAALTGGYGNSYAQQVGNQAYDEYLRGLYDKGMDLRDRAYQQYQDQRADLYNQYGLLQGADESEYGRYRDIVGDWYNEQDYWTNLYNTEADRDYDRYKDARDYNRSVYQDERDFNEDVRRYGLDYALKQRNQEMQENELDWKKATDERDYNRGVLESDRDFNEDVRRYGLDYALKQRNQELQENELDWKKATDERDYNRGVLESDRAYKEDVRKTDLDEAYRRDTLAEDIRNNNLNEAYRRDTLAEDIRNNNLNEAYRRDTLAEDIRSKNLDEAYRRDTLNEDIRNNNLNEAYRRDTLAEDIRSTNLDEAYRRDQLAWNQAVDQRDFEEQVRQFEKSLDWQNMSNDQKYASELALQMLSMGTMPSEGILQAAEIPFVDAQILMNSYQQMMAGTGGGSGGSGGGGGNDYYYLDGKYYKKGDKTYTPVDYDSIKGGDSISSKYELIRQDEAQNTYNNKHSSGLDTTKYKSQKGTTDLDKTIAEYETLKRGTQDRKQEAAIDKILANLYNQKNGKSGGK